MLAPKKVKWRKMQKGRRKGAAWRGAMLALGDLGVEGRGPEGAQGERRPPPGRPPPPAPPPPSPLLPFLGGDRRPRPPGAPLPPALLHLAPLDLFRGEHVGRGSDAESGALLLLLLGQDFAAEDPALDADDAIGGLRLGQAVVHVGAERVQRHAPLTVPFRARDLGAAESARRLD